MHRTFQVSPYVLTAWLTVVFGLSCSHAVKSTPTLPTHECVSWQSLDANSKKSFVLVSCAELDPSTWDTARIHRKVECTTSNVRLVGRREPDALDSFAEVYDLIADTRAVVTLRPEPRVSETLEHGGGVEAPIACDTNVARVYLGSPLLGYIVAYRTDGRELWRVTLPRFQTVIGRPLSDRTARGLLDLIDSEGGILGAVVPMGPFLAASYRVRGRFYQMIIHRSGAPIAVIGPWDGVLAESTSDGWVFDAGGQTAHGSWKLPTEELALRLTTTGPELLIDHFLSYNLPRSQDTQWTWRKCDADNRFGRLDLGARFDPKVDEIARKIHDGLGTDWAKKMFEDAAMANVMFRGDLPYHDWKDKVRKALLDAGADVDCVRYAREHGLMETVSW